VSLIPKIACGVRDCIAVTTGDGFRVRLCGDLGEDSGADGSATFADGESEVLFESDRVDQLDLHLGVVAGHNHLDAVRQLDFAGDVGGSNVELRLVSGEERGSSAAFFCGQDVDLCLAFGVRGDCSGFGKHCTAGHLFAVNTAEKTSDGVAGNAFGEGLLEHLDAGYDGGLRLTEADDFHGLAGLNFATFDSAGDDGAAAFDAEDVFDRHDEGQVDGTVWDRDVVIDRFHELVDLLDPFVGRVFGVLKSVESADLDNRKIVAREVVGREEFSDFEFDEFEQFFVVHHVALVEGDDECRDVYLSCEQDVLARLGHWSVGSGDDENCAVHLGGTGDHVFDVVRVAWAVNVSVVPVSGLIFGVGSCDRDAAFALFGRVVDVFEVFGGNVQLGVVRQNLRNRRCEGRLPMVDVPNRADVNVRLGPVKDLLRHFPLCLPFPQGI